MGIGCYDSLVASNISRIRHARWGRFTTSTKEENCSWIKRLSTENLLHCGTIRWVEDLRWFWLPICSHHYNTYNGTIVAADHDPEAEPEPESEPEPEPDPEQSHSHGDSHYYLSNLVGNDYIPSFSGGEYAYEFDLFGSYPSQYSTVGPYPQHHGTPSGSSSSMPIDPHDFSSMFTTPPPAPNEDVGCREHPQRDRRPPHRYTPSTAPSNHQF
ncbi:hypothetical protein Gotur_035546 [Gossypium turneri]